MSMRFLGLLIGTLLISGPAGATLDLVTNSPLVMSPGQVGGGSIVASVTNSDAVPPATDNLAGWQTSLILIPDAGATGTIGFLGAALPASYLLAGINFGLSTTISTTTTTNDSLFAFDVNFPFTGGVPVPVAPGAGLLEMEFSASGDASGSFGLFALGGLGATEWSDNAAAGPSAREFANVASTGATRIGEIRIPEPASVLLLGCGLVALAGGRSRR